MSKTGWHGRDELPPLRKSQTDKGHTDGYTKTLIFRHKSGELSWGRAIVYEGKVAWWFSEHMDEVTHHTFDWVKRYSENDRNDPIVSWAVVPDIQQIADLI